MPNRSPTGWEHCGFHYYTSLNINVGKSLLEIALVLYQMLWTGRKKKKEKKDERGGAKT